MGKTWHDTFIYPQNKLLYATLIEVLGSEKKVSLNMEIDVRALYHLRDNIVDILSKNHADIKTCYEISDAIDDIINFRVNSKLLIKDTYYLNRIYENEDQTRVSEL